jgi:hypothetical protein
MTTGLSGTCNVAAVAAAIAAGLSDVIVTSLVVESDPNGVLRAPVGTRATSSDGTQAWDNVDGGTTWARVGAAGSSGVAIPLAQKGTANGVATLDSAGKVPSAQLRLLGVPRFHRDFDALGDLYCPEAAELRTWDVGLLLSSLATMIPNVSTGAVSPVVEGGAWSFTTSSDKAGFLSGQVVANVLAGQWGVIFDAVIPDPLTGLKAYLGFATSRATAQGGPHVGITSHYDLSEPAQTRLFLECYDGTGYTQAMLPAGITGRHRFGLFKDATTIRVTVDGVVVLTSTDLSRVPGVPGFVVGYNNQADTISNLRVSRYALRTLE